MAERTYTPYERELAVWAAERDSDKATAEAFECSEATIRSWRHRAERKVTDHRASRDDDNAGDNAVMAADELAGVQVTSDEWDGGAGCYRKIPARARVLERFEIGSQSVSRGELRELRAPGAAGLAVGDLVLLGGPQYARFGDALWTVAERCDGVLLVRPARIRRDERLSDDRSQIVRKGPEDVPPGWISEEERQRMLDQQPDAIVEWHRSQLAVREGRSA